MSARGSKHPARSVAAVRIHVHELAQFYNSLDPSPFWDRDLDRDAADFIEGEFREHLAADTWHLIVHVRAGEADAQTLQAALETYYERLAASAHRELKEHFRRARVGLLAGLALFGVFMVTRTLLRATVADVPTVVDEGLVILGWLTLWRPAETFAYEWIPVYRRQRLYERLQSTRVSVQLERDGSGLTHTPSRPAASVPGS